MINRDTIRELRPLCISLEPALKKINLPGKDCLRGIVVRRPRNTPKAGYPERAIERLGHMPRATSISLKATRMVTRIVKKTANKWCSFNPGLFEFAPMGSRTHDLKSATRATDQSG